jgi:large subunit ribosomal protein L32
MSTQAKRRTSSQGKRRASHFALKKTSLNVCSKCKAKVAPHRACPECGEYKKAKTTKTASAK